MDVAFYLGSLTRFHAQEWPVPAWLEEEEPGAWAGLPTTGTNGQAVVDAGALLQEVLHWRDWMNEEVELLVSPLDWEEEQAGEPEVVECTWDALGALHLWAAYSEHPGRVRPAALPEDWTEDPAFQASVQDDFPSAFPHLLYGVDFWLPVETREVFDAPDLRGEERRFGSVAAFERELEELTRRARDGEGIELLVSPPPELPQDEEGLEALTRAAVSRLLPLFRRARERRLPVLLEA